MTGPDPAPQAPAPGDLTAHELAAIGSFLEGSGVEVAGPLTAARIAGGRSNLTFRLADHRSAWVLRMPPRAGRTPSAHDVAREFRVTRALGGTGVPVPTAVALCEDVSVIGCPFAVAEFVEGRTIQSQAQLAELDQATVGTVAVRLVEALTALHQVDHVAVGLAGYGRPDGYAARQLKRWAGQWESVATGDRAVQGDAQTLAGRLADRLPEQRSTSIVHGDFRIDNILLRVQEAVEVAAIVDWELSTLGDPLADLAMMCAYRDPAFDLILGTPSAWTSTRLPTVEELLAAYEAAGGAPVTDWGFHLALAYFKIGVIAAGIEHRRRAGAASGPGFDTAEESVPRYFSLGLSVLGGDI